MPYSIASLIRSWPPCFRKISSGLSFILVPDKKLPFVYKWQQYVWLMDYNQDKFWKYREHSIELSIIKKSHYLKNRSGSHPRKSAPVVGELKIRLPPPPPTFARRYALSFGWQDNLFLAKNASVTACEGCPPKPCAKEGFKIDVLFFFARRYTPSFGWQFILRSLKNEVGANPFKILYIYVLPRKG